MIIFGTKHVRSTVNTGTFYCPVCKQKAPYKYIENRAFGHLFFIPLLPLGSDGEYVECQRCRRPFHPDVLAYDPEEEQKQFIGEYEKLLLKSMQLAAAADSCISDAEIRAICGLYKQVAGENLDPTRVTIESERMRYLPNEAYGEAKRLAPKISDPGKEILIRAVIVVAFSDGDPSTSEYKCIYQLSQALQMTEAHFQGIVQTVVSSLTPPSLTQE
jgi:tellurite resistance protein